VDPVPDPLLDRKSGSAVIEPEPLDPWPGTLTVRTQGLPVMMMMMIIIIIIIIII
jgi:hypothetical protein